MNVYHQDNTLIMINKLTRGTEIMSRDLLFTYTTYKYSHSYRVRTVVLDIG